MLRMQATLYWSYNDTKFVLIPLTQVMYDPSQEGLSMCRTCQRTEKEPRDPSMGFSRQEYWSGVPLPSPIRNKDTT